MNDEPIIVRRYEPRDRVAVREICCDTADAGASVERFFPDREVFADVITRYYTDFAPDTTLVAEQAGRVVGYLTGCFDTRRFLRTMALRIVPAALLKALLHGSLWHRFVRQNLRLPNSQRRQPLVDYPAHFHLNLHAGYRGQGTGRQLLEKFLEHARQAGVTGIHAGVSEVNAAGRKFFECAGFVAVGREDRFRTSDQPAFTILYGLRLVK
jgi:GNAT superfamily N-acetyltransferase